jgi:hypothetical protein
MDFITPSNVMKIAQLLLNMDQQAINQKYHHDIQFLISKLKEAQFKFVCPEVNYNNTIRCTIDRIEHSMIQLINCTKTLFCCLKKEAQQKLKEEINMNLLETERINL